MSKEEERGGLDTEGEEEVGEKEKGEENEREEGDDDSEDEEEESEEEEVGIALQLPQRATRGLAYQRLIGEALEEDQAFWSHNTWADEEEDADYNCSEGEEVYEDVIDSDFDRPEDDEEGDSSSDGEGEEGDEGEGRRRRGTPTTKQGNRKERKGKKKRRRDIDLSPQERGEQQLLQHRAPEQQHLYLSEDGLCPRKGNRSAAGTHGTQPPVEGKLEAVELQRKCERISEAFVCVRYARSHKCISKWRSWKPLFSEGGEPRRRAAV